MACCLTNFSVSCARGCCSIGRRLDLSLSESSVRPMQFLRYMSIMLLFESSRSSASLKKLCCRLCCVRMAPVCHGKCSEAYSRYISLRPETWLLGRPANGSAITPAPPPPRRDSWFVRETIEKGPNNANFLRLRQGLRSQRRMCRQLKVLRNLLGGSARPASSGPQRQRQPLRVPRDLHKQHLLPSLLLLTWWRAEPHQSRPFRF